MNPIFDFLDLRYKTGITYDPDDKLHRRWQAVVFLPHGPIETSASNAEDACAKVLKKVRANP